MVFIMIIAIAITSMAVPGEIGNVQAKSKTPAKLGAKDFVFIDKGEKINFIKRTKNVEGYYWVFYEPSDTKANAKNSKISSSNRGSKIELGKTTESYIIKNYGKTKSVKVSKKETIYKFMEYRECTIDLSTWKTYLEYTYKKGKDKYFLRFYLDKKKKVTAVMYMKNKEFYKYPNKKMNPGLKFKAPKGKTITTKKINGKKVYIVPKGTKIYFKTNEMEKYDASMIMNIYDAYGKVAGESIPLYNIKKGDSLDLVDNVNYGFFPEYHVNTKKLGKYLYFTITCDSWDKWSSGNDKRKVAPAVYYFKFK